MKKFLIIVLLIVIALVAYFIVQRKSTVEPETYKIGTLFNLTGFSAIWGDAEHKAALLALEDVNSQGGARGKRLEFISEDCQSDFKNCVTALQKLINVNRVPVVLGPTWAEFFEVAAPIAESNKTVLLAASGNPNDKDYGPYTFSLWPSLSFEPAAMIDFLEKRNIRNVAVIYDQNAFAINTATSFLNIAKEKGFNVVANTERDPVNTDFRTDIVKLKNAKPQFVYVVFGDTKHQPLFARQAKELGFNSIWHQRNWSGHHKRIPERV